MYKETQEKIHQMEMEITDGLGFCRGLMMDSSNLGYGAYLNFTKEDAFNAIYIMNAVLSSISIKNGFISNPEEAEAIGKDAREKIFEMYGIDTVGTDTPDASCNEAEQELDEQEVEVLATANISTIITPRVSEKCIDEDGINEYHELVNNWREISNDVFIKPDLRWKPITNEPKRCSWILVRKTNIHNFKSEYSAERFFYGFMFNHKEISISEKDFLYEWQYINENSYNMEIADIEFQIP